MSCADASCEIRSSLTVRIRGDSRDPGSTPCAFADLIQDFQTAPSAGGLVRPSTTPKTQSIWWVFALAIGVHHLEDESASVTAPRGTANILETVDRHRLSACTAWPFLVS